jgi:hypothetical protein
MKLLFLFLCGLLLVLSHVQAASLECFIDETRSFKFDVGTRKTGSYEFKIDHKDGELKGMTYRFMVKNIGTPSEYEDYLIKQYTKEEEKRNITYSLKCKRLE